MTAAHDVLARLTAGKRPPVEGFYGEDASSEQLRGSLNGLLRRAGVQPHPITEVAVERVCRQAPEHAEAAERLFWAIEDAERHETEAWLATPEGRDRWHRFTGAGRQANRGAG